MKLYRVPCVLYSTAYIRAESIEQALKLYNTHIKEQWVDEIPDLINDMPGPPADTREISLSPSLTGGDAEEIEEIEEEPSNETA